MCCVQICMEQVVSSHVLFINEVLLFNNMYNVKSEVTCFLMRIFLSVCLLRCLRWLAVMLNTYLLLNLKLRMCFSY